MAGNEFAHQAVGQRLRDLEENLIQSARQYEDAERYDDPTSAADAMKTYAAAEREYNYLTGKDQPQQRGQLSNAQRNFLSRRQAGGDELTPQRMADYARGHDKAMAAGLTPDTREYFSAVANYVDHLGDGRQPPLNEREAARICGVSEDEYARQANKLAAMRARGEYGQ
jgi:hypothetical protein